MSKTYNLFISHSWSYPEAYDGLTKLLSDRPYFIYKDFSVPKDDPITSPLLYEAIKRQIAQCHVVLVMAGVYASYGEWIDKEIKIAKTEFSRPKPIIAVEPWGSERTSRVVKDSADKIVGWNTESIISAIRGLAP